MSAIYVVESAPQEQMTGEWLDHNQRLILVRVKALDTLSILSAKRGGSDA